MTRISYPTKVRSFLKTPQLNSIDCITEHGARISTPLYIDLPITERKALFNAVREACNARTQVRDPKAASGIVVETASNDEAKVESFLGQTTESLRSTLFGRGGIQLDLILKIQSVAGLEIVSVEDVKAAFAAKLAEVKNFVKTYEYQ